jgi:hypothetical protein
MALECISSLIDLAQGAPKLFKPVVNMLVAFMSNQMKTTDLEDGTRQNCLEIMLTLTEAAPGMMRKNSSFGPSVIPILLEWVLIF